MVALLSVAGFISGLIGFGMYQAGNRQQATPFLYVGVGLCVLSGVALFVGIPMAMS